MKKQVIAGVTLVMLSSLAGAQFLTDANWQEGPVPEPPAFSTERLLRFEVNPGSSLVYGIDPQTLRIGSVDRVVRYVVVATSPSGARNVFYEGIRCPSGEVKTYAHHNGQQWVKANDPQWTPMLGRPSRHAAQLARQGACDNSGTPGRTEDIVRTLKQASAAAAR